MSVIAFPTRSDNFLSLKNALRHMEHPIAEQTVATRRYKKTISYLKDEMKAMEGYLKDFEAALSRIDIRGVGNKSRTLAKILRQ